MTALKKDWGTWWNYSWDFGPHEARQQLGCLFRPGEWVLLTRTTPNKGGAEDHRMKGRVFCIFSSPDTKHKVALSSSYDLRILRNTNYIFARLLFTITFSFLFFFNLFKLKRLYLKVKVQVWVQTKLHPAVSCQCRRWLTLHTYASCTL